MNAILTDIALQLKGNLSFLLGLGGMFTVAKSLITGLFVLPKTVGLRPALETDAKRLIRWMYRLAIASVVLLIAALLLYFVGPVASIDPDALKKSGCQLSVAQQWAVGFLALIAVALTLCEAASSALKYHLGLVTK